MAYIYDLTDTWNASGTTFNGIKLNVTDSASASSSKLVTLQTNGTEHFSITKAGVGYVSGNLGVGTTSPATKLHLLTASATAVAVRAANSVSYAELQVDSSGNSQLVAPGGVQIFNTNGSERVRINSTGNVGIGTASPGAKLAVAGGQINTVADEAYGIALNATTGNTRVIPYAATYSGSVLVSYSAGYAGYGPFSIDASRVQFFTNGNERMRIDASGNVGIGTSSPANKLDVTGIIRSVSATFGKSDVIAETTASTGTGYSRFILKTTDREWRLINDASTSGSPFLLYDATAAATRLLVDSSGNVGIGTSSPGYKLQVNGTMAGVVASGANYSAIRTSDFYYMTVSADGLNTLTDANGSAPMLFRTGGTERMRLNSSGFLLVGATSPMGGNTSSEFKVTGAGSWPLTLNANDRGLLIRNSASSAGVYAYFEYNGGTNNGQISFSGGTTSYVTTSDARVKKNIVDAPDAGALIDAIKVRSWDFKVDDMHWRYGMVAQELISIAPEAVTVPEDEDKMMGIDYSKLVPMLIKEVQSLRARVAQLEGN